MTVPGNDPTQIPTLRDALAGTKILSDAAKQSAASAGAALTAVQGVESSINATALIINSVQATVEGEVASFNARYIGASATDPTVDAGGQPLIAGATYFNTTTDRMNVYTGASWFALDNTIISTTGAPSNAVGNNGDFAIDTAAGMIYGPKASGVWPSGSSIVGPIGPTGATTISGSVTAGHVARFVNNTTIHDDAGLIVLTSDVSGVLPVANGGTNGQLPVAQGGTGQTSAAAARGSSGLNIDSGTARGDAIYTILATDRFVYTNAALTTARVFTLPAANAVNPGQILVVSDLAGGVTATNTLTVQRAGADTIDGGTTQVLDVAFAEAWFRSDGTSKWMSHRKAPYGTSANQDLRIDSSGKYPALDGSQITNVAPVPFGDGSDGNVTVNGSLTLSRSMFYNNLTIGASAAITMNGYKISVCGTLDLSAAPAGAFLANGTSGNNATGAAGGSATTAMPSSQVVYAGATSSGAGATGTNGTGAGSAIGVAGVNGGSGGADGTAGSGTNPGGSAAGAAAAPTPVGISSFLPLGQQQTTSVTITIINGAGYGSKAASGGGSGTVAGGGAGTPGSGAGDIIIAANTIARGSNATAGIFQAKGGAAGNSGAGAGPNAGGGGGPGGGGGGFVLLLYKSLTGSTITNAIDVSGGKGGDGGNGGTSATGGNGGSSGYSGMVMLWPVGVAPTITNSIAGSAGTTHTTVTGGAGASINTEQVSL